MKNKAVLHSLGHAILVFLYVSGVAGIMTHLEKAGVPDKTIWVPVMMLMLFVFSAAVMGALVFGRPVLLYVSGAKAEALKFFGYTLGWMFVITFLLLLSQLIAR